MLRREVKKNPGIAQTIRGVTNCKGQMMLKHIKTEYKDQEPPDVECATDYEREDKIDRAMSLMKSAGTIEARNVAWGQMRALIAGRSEDTVKRMEAERGLV